jgi:hypothetical protein
MDRLARTMRRWLIVLAVWGVASTGLTIYLALQVWRGHGL